MSNVTPLSSFSSSFNLITDDDDSTDLTDHGELFDGDETKDDNLKELEEYDRQVRNILLSSLDEKTSKKVDSEMTAYEIWSTLKETYEVKTVMKLFKKFRVNWNDLKMKMDKLQRNGGTALDYRSFVAQYYILLRSKLDYDRAMVCTTLLNTAPDYVSQLLSREWENLPLDVFNRTPIKDFMTRYRDLCSSFVGT